MRRQRSSASTWRNLAELVDRPEWRAIKVKALTNFRNPWKTTLKIPRGSNELKNGFTQKDLKSAVAAVFFAGLAMATGRSIRWKMCRDLRRNARRTSFIAFSAIRRSHAG